MAQTREAVDTIKGYYYQFDYFILKLLEEDNKEALICIEGIEDIDIENVDLKKSIQCKYYAKTEYQHSILKKPIRLMLEHYVSNKKSNLKYYIYGYYKSGQNKLPNDIDINFLKEKFLTYTEKEEIEKIFMESIIDDKKFVFSKLSSDNEINVPVDGNKFFNKHIAIVGSTGSGKSHTVAKIIQTAVNSKEYNSFIDIKNFI